MQEFFIRDDDISFDSDVEHVKTFCEICDKHGFKIIHAITPIGATHNIDSSWNNDLIVARGGCHTLADNKTLLDYLLSRNDKIGTHGLFHTHKPSLMDQRLSVAILKELGFTPEYAVLPFNEESPEYSDTVLGLKVLGKSQRLEDYLEKMPKANEIPTDEIVYLHEWRFGPGKYYSWDNLDRTLERIKNGL
mgnify:FL=1